MAKVTHPLLSLEARGTVGQDLTFRHGAKAANVYRPPLRQSAARTRTSAAQQTIRDIYREALAAWRALNPGTRETWNALAVADPRAVNGWNLYLAAYTPAPTAQTVVPITLAIGTPTDLRDLGRDPSAHPTTRALDLRHFFAP